MKTKITLLGFAFIMVVSISMGIYTRSHMRTVLVDEKKISERRVSFFTKEYEEILDVLENAMLEESAYVLEVIATGKHQYVGGYLAQEVSFVRTVRGKLNKNCLKDKIYVMGSGWVEDSVTSQVSTGFVNYMKEGEHYIVFASDVFQNSLSNTSIVRANAELVGLRYLNISSDKSYAVVSDEDTVCYEKVVDSEFFTNNEETLEKLEQYKYKILKKLHIKVLW